MEFIQLKKSLRENIKNAYLLFGDDNFVLSKAYALISESVNLSMPEINEYKFSEDVDFTNVVRALQTFPFMSDYKLIYVDARSSIKLSNISVLEAYLLNQNPSSILVINAGDNSKIFDKIKNNIEWVDCNRLKTNMVQSIIVNELGKSNKQITLSALNKLCDYCLNDLSSIQNEITKLDNYSSLSIINDKDIDELVSKSFEFQIYELSEALSKKQSDKCFQIVDSLKDKRDNIKLILPTISNHFRRLFYIAISDNTTSELASLLNVKEFAVKKGMEQCRMFSKKQLKAILDAFIELDYEIKTSSISVENAIDYIILKILNI